MNNASGLRTLDEMRKAAEAKLDGSAPTNQVHLADMILHELQVHQIELEMQNETLRNAQLELETSRDRYMDLYDFAPVGYLTLTPDAIIAEINLTGAALLGVERQELLERRFWQFIAPEDSDRWHRYFMEALKKNSPHNCELLLLRGDGSRFHANLNCLRMECNGRYSLRITLTDITERRQHENMLHESEEKFSAIFDGALDGILLADIETRKFNICNPEFCRMLGYSSEEISRLGVADIHPPQALPHVIEQFERHTRRESQFATDIPVMRKDGSVFCADIKSSQVKIGCKTYLIGVFRDVTEHKRIEMELKEQQQLLRELASLNVASREAEARHIAREVHDELGQLLTALRMDVSLLRIQFGSLDPALMKKTMDMLALVDQAIQGARNVALNLRPAVLDLGIVPAIGWLCDNFPGLRDTACSMRVAETPPGLDNAQIAALFRIVQESLTNVARHAVANSVRITLGQCGNDVIVEICDDGQGFDFKALPAKKSFGLMGMRERALALGGKVEIASAPAKGTVVSVRIPLKLNGHGKDAAQT